MEAQQHGQAGQPGIDFLPVHLPLSQGFKEFARVQLNMRKNSSILHDIRFIDR